MIDRLILIAASFFALIGLFRGAVREVLGLAGMIFAALGTRYLHVPLANILADSFDFDISAARILAAACLFVGIAAMFTVLSALITRLLKASGLGGANRILGAIFGGAKFLIAVFVVLLILDAMPLEYFPDPVEAALSESRFNAIIRDHGPEIVAAMRESDMVKAFLASAANNLDLLSEKMDESGLPGEARPSEIVRIIQENEQLKELIADKDFIEYFQDEQAVEDLLQHEIISRYIQSLKLGTIEVDL